MAKQKQKTKPQNGLAIIKEEPRHYDQTPTDLIAMAIANNLDIDKLERLMVMQEKWQAKQAEKLFFEAFGKFQSIIPELKKNKEVKFDHKEGGGSTNYKYQELADIALHIRQPLADCGLSYRWDQKEEAGVISVTCILAHTSGHQERSQPLSGAYDTSGKKNVIQQKASTITYLRRYTLTGMLGLSTMEADNDGKGGQQPSATTAKPLPTPGQFENLRKRVSSSLSFDKAKDAFDNALKHFNLKPEEVMELESLRDAKQTVSA